MNANDLDRLATSLAVPGTRRRLLRLLAALPIAGLLSLHPAEAAKRHRRRKKRKRQKRRALSGPTCPAACGSNCAFCVTRADGSALCGSGVGFSCTWSCAEDDDCPHGVVGPYCINAITRLSDGSTAPVCNGGNWCGSVTPCA